MNLHELHAYNSYTKLQQPNRSNLSAQNKSKVSKLSLTPRPSKSRVKQSKNVEIDLTSTILDVPSSVRTQNQSEFNELLHVRSELSQSPSKTIRNY